MARQVSNRKAQILTEATHLFSRSGYDRVTVKQVAFASGSSPTYPVVIGIDKATEVLRPGMAANITFLFGNKEESQQAQLLAPVAAVGEDAEGKFVYILRQNPDSIYIVEKHRVTIGALRQEGFEVEGVNENDLVATAGLQSILAGMQVKLLEQ